MDRAGSDRPDAAEVRALVGSRPRHTPAQVPFSDGRGGAVGVVCARAAAAALASDARSLRTARQRGDAPADPGAAGRAVLRTLARALSDERRPGGRAGAGRAGAVERAGLQPARAGTA